MSRASTFSKAQRLHLYKCLKNYQLREIQPIMSHITLISDLPQFELHTSQHLKVYHRRLKLQTQQLNNYVNIILNDLKRNLDGHS